MPVWNGYTHLKNVDAVPRTELYYRRDASSFGILLHNTGLSTESEESQYVVPRVLCFLYMMTPMINWKKKLYGRGHALILGHCQKCGGPPLWSSGQSSRLQIQRFGFDSRRYHIFWEVVGLERGPLSLVSTIEEPLERKISGSGLEGREYGCRGPLCWPRGTLYPQMFLMLAADVKRKQFLTLQGLEPWHLSFRDRNQWLYRLGNPRCLLII
jgi:hypothetical protein